MVIESLGLPMFEDIETLAEETRLTEKLVFFITKEDAKGRYKKFYNPEKRRSVKRNKFTMYVFKSNTTLGAREYFI